MNRDRWELVQDLFDRVAHVEAAERAAWLSEQCGGQTDLRDEVLSLLKAADEADEILGIFEHPLPFFAPADAATPPTNSGGPAASIETVTAEPPMAPGDTVGNYQIEREIGRGGMGVVYAAHDTRLQRTVALKFLPRWSHHDAEAKGRLIAEARAAAALDHPNVATVYEIGEAQNGRLFIAMGFYEGRTLAARVKEGPIPQNEALDYAFQMARGLQKAHEHGIVHRDVKPANVIVTLDAVVKILDFGIARTAESELTRPGAMLGTVAYAAPEQIRGETVDHRADIWAFGVVLYEMLTGERPFGRPYESSLLYSILNEDPTPLRRHLPDAPEALEALIGRCLHKDPGARHQSIREVASALSQLSRPAPEKAASRGNLPVPLNVFVGREDERKDAKALFEETRLLTLTGTGGMGKTRLSIQLASELRTQFPDGIWFVPLAAITDSTLVPSSIARILEVREQGANDLFAGIKDFLEQRASLLVLDNFEQVIEAGPLIVELLQACPRVKALVTSRAPLRVRGERVFAVPPLKLPDARGASPETLARSEAVMLFVQCAQAVNPAFELRHDNAADVAAICQRVEGLPLAIELAAARIRLLDPADIASRLENRLRLLTGGARDLPSRHQTLRESIGWSYGLLTKDQQRIFRRLSVFVSGWSIDTAEKICEELDDRTVDVLDATAALIDNSLVRKEASIDGQTRFSMLGMIREFGGECLAGSGEADAAAKAHAGILTEYAESAESWLTGPQQTLWLARLEQEYDDFRAVLEWSLTSDGDPETGFRLGAALWRFWLIRGRLSEGRDWMNRLLDHPQAPRSPQLHARLLAGSGTLAHNQGHYAAARTAYEAALALYREIGDRRGVANTLNNLGWVAWRQGEFATSRRLSEEGLFLHQSRDDRRGSAMALNNLAWVSHFEGELEAAQSFHEQCLALQEDVGDRRAIAFSRNNLGWVLCDRGELDRGSDLVTDAVQHFDAIRDKQLTAFGTTLLGLAAHRRADLTRARTCLEQTAIRRFREIGDVWGLSFALDALGTVLRDEDDLGGARTCFEESLRIRQLSEDRWGVSRCLYGLAEVNRRDGRIPEAASKYLESIRASRGRWDRAGLAQSAEGLALIASRNTDYESAVRLLAAADALRRTCGPEASPQRAAELEQLRHVVHEAGVGKSSAAATEDLLAGESAAGPQFEDLVALAEQVVGAA